MKPAKRSENYGGEKSEASPAAAHLKRGPVVANEIITAADGLVINIYHNGKELPDSDRQTLGEQHGAAMEEISMDVRQGDWVVFNVASPRMAKGDFGFVAAGVNGRGNVAFVSNAKTGQWSYCDDPGKVDRFISDPLYMMDHEVRTPARTENNLAMVDKQVSDAHATTIWGGARNTWIKFVATKK